MSHTWCHFTHTPAPHLTCNIPGRYLQHACNTPATHLQRIPQPCRRKWGKHKLQHTGNTHATHLRRVLHSCWTTQGGSTSTNLRPWHTCNTPATHFTHCNTLQCPTHCSTQTQVEKTHAYCVSRGKPSSRDHGEEICHDPCHAKFVALAAGNQLPLTHRALTVIIVGALVTWAIYNQGQLLLWSSLIITGAVPGYNWPRWLRLQLSVTHTLTHIRLTRLTHW